jgi:hypothetical protein
MRWEFRFLNSRGNERLQFFTDEPEMNKSFRFGSNGPRHSPFNVSAGLTQQGDQECPLCSATMYPEKLPLQSPVLSYCLRRGLFLAHRQRPFPVRILSRLLKPNSSSMLVTVVVRAGIGAVGVITATIQWDHGKSGAACAIVASTGSGSLTAVDRCTL